jgi:hypothetical protein
MVVARNPPVSNAPPTPAPSPSLALPWEVRVSRRAPRNTLAQEVAGPVRAAFEPRYGRALGDDEVGEIADNFRRFNDVLAAWDAEDRAGLGPGGVRAANDQPTPEPRCPA